MNTTAFAMRFVRILFLATFTCLFGCKSSDEDFTQYVNTFIGTDGTGHTFPGPSMPFGMVQPGPDNRDSGWDYTSGYQYKDSVILGFSQTRASGTGINEFGDILLQPITKDKNENFAEVYLKSSESAVPGCYTVTLKNHVKVELTCTERVALHRYTYPSNSAMLLVDLQHGLKLLTDSLVLESDVKIEDEKSISGFCHTKNWVERRYFFTINFSQPFSRFRVVSRRAKENAPRYIFTFDLPNQTLLTKIALSTVSVDGAKKNMRVELPGWDFDSTFVSAKAIWNSYLSRIKIEADKKKKKIFYSCLYRLFLQPSNIADVDGRYRGADDVIRISDNKEYYSTLSLWDTYRAAHPLYTLVAPEKVNGFVRSMIAHSKAAGFLPIWTAWGKDNYCMIGNHSIPVIVDAYGKGFSGFNSDDALNEMIRSTTENHINSDWTTLNRFGYYPFDLLDNEAVSRTLEHGIDDYSVALMADIKGNKNVSEMYQKRALNYKNIFEVSTQQFRGRDSRGKWRDPFDPMAATSPMNNPGDYTEANAWQYFWTPAQYDTDGVIELLQGKKNFTAKLDSFFTIQSVNPNRYLGQEAMIGQYAHGNEPSHHVAYLYLFSDKPERGRELVTQICNQFYDDSPSGMIGNDDCGQMSAWYIFSTLGFYPVNPANGEYVLGIPQVSRATVTLRNGSVLIVSKLNQSGNVFFNGSRWNSPTIRHNLLNEEKFCELTFK